MPMTKLMKRSEKERILIAGAPNTGKTYSLASFIYGPYAHDPDKVEEAQEYAGQKHMIVLSCPGEKGHLSLPQGHHVTNYTYTLAPGEGSGRVWRGFEAQVEEFLTGSYQPDVLAIDGLHCLYEYYVDDVSEGAYFAGTDFNTRLYGRCHVMFGQFLARLYHSPIPTIVCTTWEEWENRDDPASQQAAVPMKQTPKRLYPALPGRMAKAVAGHFDATLSARLSHSCISGLIGKGNCLEHDRKEEHYVWQFMPYGDVGGVGVKGLRMPVKIVELANRFPYLDQKYNVLHDFIKVFAQ